MEPQLPRKRSSLVQHEQRFTQPPSGTSMVQGMIRIGTGYCCFAGDLVVSVEEQGEGSDSAASNGTPAAEEEKQTAAA